MTDHGRPISFGYFLTPDTTDYAALVRRAQLADRLGLELIGIQDHPYVNRFFDTWTLISTLAAQTERITFFPDVINLPLRPPAVLAKAAASLAVMTGGRFAMGLGAGASWDGIAAMGGPRHSPGEAATGVEEAIQIMRQFWGDERSVRVDGKIYTVHGARPGPRPPQPISIWLGAGGPRMLAMLGRLADGWIPSNSYFPPETLPPLQAQIDEAATAVGRDPASIRRLYNVFGDITTGVSTDRWHGPVDQWIETLTSIALDQGMDTFVFGTDDEIERQLELLAQEIAPRVKANVERARGNLR